MGKHDIDYRMWSLKVAVYNFIVGVLPKKGWRALIGKTQLANPLDMTTTKIVGHDFSWHSSVWGKAYRYRSGCDKAYSMVNYKILDCEKWPLCLCFREALKYHEKTHLKECKHFCTMCEAGFPRPAALRQHMKEKHHVELKHQHTYPCTQSVWM